MREGEHGRLDAAEETARVDHRDDVGLLDRLIADDRRELRHPGITVVA
jgi:hypothetical protein